VVGLVVLKILALEDGLEEDDQLVPHVVLLLFHHLNVLVLGCDLIVVELDDLLLLLDVRKYGHQLALSLLLDFLQ
jgi:hypothetical protein